jgi:hypothetical protein
LLGCEPGVCVGYTASAPFCRFGRSGELFMQASPGFFQ